MQKNDEKSALALLSLADPLPKEGKTMGYVRVCLFPEMTRHMVSLRRRSQ